MPMINIEFDDSKLKDLEIQKLSEAIQKIVSEVTGIEDVFVYANTSKIKIKIAPVEIWVRMSAPKIKDLDILTNDIKMRLSEWKTENNFSQSINLTVIPMNWKVEINI